MGKKLIIKNADFSQNAVEPIVPSDLLYNFSGSVYGEPIDTGLHLLTSVTEWTMFVKWSNIAIGSTSYSHWLRIGADATGLLVVCSYNRVSQQYYINYRRGNYYTIDGTSYIEPIENTGKIGFRRNGNVGQITFDGITWVNTNIILPVSNDSTLILKNTAYTGIADVKIFNSATKDISQLFR